MTGLASLFDELAGLSPEIALVADGGQQSHEDFPAARRVIALGNQLPMALLALDRLGATPQRLDDFAAAYRRRLVPLTDMTLPVVTDPMELRGEVDAFPRLEVFFRTALNRAELRDVLQRYLSPLMSGIAGAALHPLNRLAYGLLGHSESEIAAGLAHATVRYMPLPVAVRGEGASNHDSSPPANEIDPRAILRRLRGDASFDYRPQGQILLDAAIGEACSPPRFAAVVDDLILADDPWRQLAPVAAAFHVVRDDLISLTAVTAIHAARVVTSELEHRSAAELWRHVWRAIAGLYLVAGKPELPSSGYLAQLRDQVGRPDAAPDWPRILARAAETADAHAATFVFTCLEEGRRSGDRLYRWLAWRAIT
jgi:hypothetical protein